MTLDVWKTSVGNVANELFVSHIGSVQIDGEFNINANACVIAKVRASAESLFLLDFASVRSVTYNVKYSTHTSA